ADALSGVIQYDTDLFDAATIRRMIGHFGQLLAEMTAGATRRLSELQSMSVFNGERVGAARDATTPPQALAATSSAHPAAMPIAPRTDLERRVAALWADVLGHARVGVTDDFFDL